MADSQVKLKLLIDTSGQKVLFAEAGKDFVDFLFYLLSLPLSTVVRLLKEKGEVGCLNDLYDSLESLNDTYVQPGQTKTTLLYHKSPLSLSEIPLLLSNDQCTTRTVYMCNSYNRHSYASDVPNNLCPDCNAKMSVAIPLVNSTSSSDKKSSSTSSKEQGGFVKGVVTYMVMDNLEVKPMSTISSITMLNKFNVQNVGALKEKTVVMGVDEGLKLLKVSMGSKNVLTSVFLGDSNGINN